MPPPPHRTASRPPSATEWALLVLLASVWGSSFTFIELAQRELPPITVMAGRTVLGTIALAGILLLMGKRIMITPKAIRLYASVGAINTAIPFGLISIGQTSLPSSMVAVLVGAMPVFANIFAHLIIRSERLSRYRLIGIITAFFGLLVIFGPAILISGEIDPFGVAMVLSASMMIGFATVYARKLSAAGIGPIESAAGQCAFAALWLALAMTALERPWSLAMPGWEAITAVAVLGVACTAFTYSMYYYLLNRAGASNVSLVAMLATVTGVLLGVTLFGEKLLWYQFAGITLMIGGLTMISYRRNRATIAHGAIR